jgi:hypothetical protein
MMHAASYCAVVRGHEDGINDPEQMQVKMKYPACQLVSCKVQFNLNTSIASSKIEKYPVHVLPSIYHHR